MTNQTNSVHAARMEEAKKLASRLLHMQYCDGNADSVTAFFAPQFTWLGAGEEQYIVGRDAAVEMFHRLGNGNPPCDIREEEYDAIEPSEGLYVVSGRMWIVTTPGAKVRQRVTFVFQETEQGLLCAHIHCSNPYQEMVGEELFPEKIGRRSYECVQERLTMLEAQMIQQNRQLDVILSSVAGGLKISRDEEAYPFTFVSREAAALFGYTVEEFLAVTGGTALGIVYPPDRERVLTDCAEAFRDGGLSYSTRYRVRCRDGSLKWIMDSGKKALDAEGNWVVNSLYLDVTQEEEDAHRLREQTRLLTSIYDTVPCGIIRFARRANGEYTLISLNPAALSLLGYDTMKEGLRDWHGGVLGTVLEEDRVMLRETYRLLHEVGDRQDREYRALWRDGSLHWLDGTNMIVGRTSEGDAIIQRTLVDITRRKELQQQLDWEQEMYRVAMESSSDTLFEYRVDTDLFISYEPLLGQGVVRREFPRCFETLPEKQLVHSEDISMMSENIRNGRTEIFEVRMATSEAAQGEYRWHRVSSRPIQHEGRPSRVVGTIRNIHSMKETLSENSTRLHMSQSALQVISDVYISIFYVNLTENQYYAVRLPQTQDAMEFPRIGRYAEELCVRLLGYVEEEERPHVARVCDRDRLLRQFSQIDDHREVEFHRSQPGDASLSWLRLEIHPIASESSEAKTTIVTLRNVSSEKQQELERRLEEKKAKQALEEAYEGARRANLAKSEFLSRMSHDIRTPMNAILGMTAIAERQLDNRDKLADCLSKIRVSGNLLLGLINEVLDMSKIESGSAYLSESVFRLGDILSTVEQIIRPDAEQKEQRFTLCSSIRNDTVCGDAMRVQQILLNLLSNAVKYTEKGGHIALTAEEKLSDRRGVGCFEFTVEDDGIGMPPAFMGNLFKPFERAEDPRVSAVQGTGLGLAITHNLVQMMGGDIRVDSQLGRGTRFTVTIFLKLSDMKARGRPAETAERNTASFAAGTRILLAEDNALNQEIAKELLNMAGLEVVCAGDGRQAVELFTTQPAGTYALILMDIQMPVMNGYEASRAIRELGKTGQRPDAAAIPIIALTANAFADDAYQARQAGMNEHVAKPLEVDRLLRTLHRWLDL